MASKKKNIYPQISVTRIKNPSRFYAIPILGWLIKCILVIPVGIYLFILNIANLFIWIINSFYIVITGKYWKVAYDLNVGIIRMTTKVMFFMFGMTNKYPGFDFEIDDSFSITIPYPKTPNRIFAIPILGFIFRLVLIIPYIIYQTIIARAASIALVVGCFFVVFTGRYPESDYELNRDAFRLDMAVSLWFLGLSDEYPSFWISMNHTTIKVILIILSIILIGINYGTGFMDRSSERNSYQQQHYKMSNTSSQGKYNQQ